MGWNRAASVEYAGTVGSGCVVAPGLILTAYHVVQPVDGLKDAPIVVRVMDGGTTLPKAGMAREAVGQHPRLRGGFRDDDVQCHCGEEGFRGKVVKPPLRCQGGQVACGHGALGVALKAEDLVCSLDITKDRSDRDDGRHGESRIQRDPGQLTADNPIAYDLVRHVAGVSTRDLKVGVVDG